MMHIAIAVLVSFAAGFSFGRIKNVAKLSAVKSELQKFEYSASSEVSTLVARIKAKL